MLLISLKEVYETKEPTLTTSLQQFRSFSCSGRENGIYPDLSSGCASYFRCLSGAVYGYKCPENRLMDWKKGECLPQDEVVCPTQPPSTQPCVQQSDGFYPDYSDQCSSYYVCSNHTVSDRGKCGKQSRWDILTGSCSEGQISCSPPTCWGFQNGNHPAPGSQCGAYFTCADGVRTDHNCPYPNIFDYSKKKCVRDDSSICYEGICEGRVNGYHSSPKSSCQKYFKCFNGAMVQLSECPDGQIFDGEKCILTDEFICWDTKEESCENKSDGYHPANDSKCRGFNFCRQNQIIQSFRCFPGFVFDGEKCIENDNYICQPTRNEPNCENKIDGYYTIEGSNCKSFIFCKRGQKISGHSCPGNYVFNGEYCVDSLLYQCPNKNKLIEGDVTLSINLPRVNKRSINYLNKCNNKENGFHIDIETNCTQFFYCFNENLMFNQYCPGNTLYNGNRCVNSDKFNCPVEVNADDCKSKGPGYYQEFSSGCQSFYDCSSGSKILLQCPIGFKHDGISCKQEELIYCPSQALCLSKLDGVHIDKDRNSQSYYECKNEVVQIYRSCKDGEIYNGKSCVPQFFAKYPLKNKFQPCIGKQNGYHANKIDQCRSYFYCRNELLLKEFTCGNDYVFNGTDCVPLEKYSCPIHGCRAGVFGFHQHLQSKCKMYYYCSNGDLTRFKCPDGRIFNGSRCVLETDYSCPDVTEI